MGAAAGSHNGELGEEAQSVTEDFTWEKGGEGGEVSESVWFLQKTNLLGEVPILLQSP
jgi:hypothetical protein